MSQQQQKTREQLTHNQINPNYDNQKKLTVNQIVKATSIAIWVHFYFFGEEEEISQTPRKIKTYLK